MSELMMYLLYLIYYIFPLGFIILIVQIWQKKSELRGTTYFSKGREIDSSAVMKDDRKDIKNFQVAIVLLILLFMPLSHYSSTTLSDGLMDRDRIFRGEGSYIDNPVETKIGPSSDTDSVIGEMERNDLYWADWIIDGIKEEIDFDELTRLPDRLGVYKLRRSATREEHVIITYSYFSPIPITKVYGFGMLSGQKEIWLQEGPNTIIYPMDPADADPF